MKSRLDVYVRILSKLSPSIRLHTLVLTLPVPDRSPPLEDEDLGDAADWIVLDQLLAQDRFSSLKIVKINFDTELLMQPFTSALIAESLSLFEKRLPTLYKRRVLQSWHDFKADRVQGELSTKRYQWHSHTAYNLVIKATIRN